MDKQRSHGRTNAADGGAELMMFMLILMMMMIIMMRFDDNEDCFYPQKYVYSLENVPSTGHHLSKFGGGRGYL